eukprot:Hpha_TRINITY_DN3349_c0_g1::TRINITY_DN3349_c0_g1_i1::g.172222::m.172222
MKAKATRKHGAGVKAVLLGAAAVIGIFLGIRLGILGGGEASEGPGVVPTRLCNMSVRPVRGHPNVFRSEDVWMPSPFVFRTRDQGGAGNSGAGDSQSWSTAYTLKEALAGEGALCTVDTGKDSKGATGGDRGSGHPRASAQSSGAASRVGTSVESRSPPAARPPARPLSRPPPRPAAPQMSSALIPGRVLLCRTGEQTKRRCVVKEVRPNKLLVHYLGTGKKDEWLKVGSSQYEMLATVEYRPVTGMMVTVGGGSKPKVGFIRRFQRPWLVIRYTGSRDERIHIDDPRVSLPWNRPSSRDVSRLSLVSP